MVAIPSQINSETELIRKRVRKIVLKNQRRELNQYFISSSVYYIFIIILSFCIIPISFAIKD